MRQLWVAAVCAERGVEAHVVLRGEPPRVPTGHCLLCHVFGVPHYVSRAEYVDRRAVLQARAAQLAGDSGAIIWAEELEQRGLGAVRHLPQPGGGTAAGRGRQPVTGCLDGVRRSSAGPTGGGPRAEAEGGGDRGGSPPQDRGVAVAASGAVAAVGVDAEPSAGCRWGWERRRVVAVVNEGAASAAALLGVMRMVHKLVGGWPGLAARRCVMVVDSGTGTTAIGCALGVQLLGLPWRVVGVMLAGTSDYYFAQEKSLLASYNNAVEGRDAGTAPLPLTWIPRRRPRRFGTVLKGEVATCRRIARATGILVDPIYTLAAWETAVDLACAMIGSGAASMLGAAKSRSPAECVENGGEGAPRVGAACSNCVSESGSLFSGNLGSAGWARNGEQTPEQSEGQSGPRSALQPACSQGNRAADQPSALCGPQGASGSALSGSGDDDVVIMVHTGGALGLFGVSQRHPDAFLADVI